MAPEADSPRVPMQRRPERRPPPSVFRDDAIERRFRRHQAVALRASAIDRATGNVIPVDFGGLTAAQAAWRHLRDAGLTGDDPSDPDDLVAAVLLRRLA